MSDRSERFRESMDRLDVRTSASEVIAGGYYVAPAAPSVADELVLRIEREPTSSHAVIGGPGSGKTTQLLLACERINQNPGIRAFYIDARKWFDLHFGIVNNDTYWLIAYELVRFGELFQEEAGQLDERVLAECRVNLDAVVDMTMYGGGERWHTDLWRELGNSMHSLCKELSLATRLIVVLDSLDQPRVLQELSSGGRLAVTALQRHGIGVVFTAPIHAPEFGSRMLLDPANRYYLPSVNISHDQQGLAYFVRVLRARIPEDICADELCTRLAELSGGVLRDLIALARLAVEAAHDEGADTVRASHVEAAAQRFGETHVRGLQPDDYAVLQKICTAGEFVAVTEREIALLHTGRVIGYRGAGARYRVHPTILPLLERSLSS